MKCPVAAKFFRGAVPIAACASAGHSSRCSPVRMPARWFETERFSLVALERRQSPAAEPGGAADNRSVFVVIVLLQFPSSAFEYSFAGAGTGGAEDQADAWITNLELDLEQWAQDSGKNAIFFYMEDPECINGALDQEGLLHLAEQAAAGGYRCAGGLVRSGRSVPEFLHECRVQLDDMGQAELPLTAWRRMRTAENCCWAWIRTTFGTAITTNFERTRGMRTEKERPRTQLASGGRFVSR